MEQPTVSLNITHTPKPPYPSSPPHEPPGQGSMNQNFSLTVKPIKIFTMLTTQHDKSIIDKNRPVVYLMFDPD